MCNHLNLKILIHIFTIIYFIMIIIKMRGENFVAHLEGLGGTLVAHHWFNLQISPEKLGLLNKLFVIAQQQNGQKIKSYKMKTLKYSCFPFGAMSEWQCKQNFIIRKLQIVLRTVKSVCLSS
jgi:hypothetical protein